MPPSEWRHLARFYGVQVSPDRAVMSSSSASYPSTPTQTTHWSTGRNPIAR